MTDVFKAAFQMLADKEVDKPIVIQVGLNNFIGSILEYTTLFQGRTIFVDPDTDKLDRVKAYCKKNWPRSQWCLSKHQPEDFYKQWPDKCDLLYVDDDRADTGFLKLGSRVPLVITNARSALNPRLEGWGWVCLLEDEQYLWFSMQDLAK